MREESNRKQCHKDGCGSSDPIKMSRDHSEETN